MSSKYGVSPKGPSAETDLDQTWYEENGRCYGKWRKGKYMFPCDDEELNRLDIFHKFFLVARSECLHGAVLMHSEDLRILDLGTGTGIWAIEMADRYTDAEVIGIDLMLMQPPEIPPNLAFWRADMESPWHGLGEESWDLIHLRMLKGSVQSWPNLYAKIFSHLKPSYGSIEQVEIDWLPRCDDGTLHRNANLCTWAEELLSAMDEADRPMRVEPGATENSLRAAGFVDICEQVVRIPYGDWPVKPFEKEIGRWFGAGFIRGLVALTLAPLTRVGGRSVEEVHSLVGKVQEEIRSRQHHAYCLLYIWTAKRP